MPDEELMLRLQEAGALLAEGFDDALVGDTAPEGRAVYDAKKMAEILLERDGMDYQDAMEFLYFNVFGSHVGDMTPIYIWLSETQDD